MNTYIQRIACFALLLQANYLSAQAPPESLMWNDVSGWGVEGRILPNQERQRWYDRFPVAAKNDVTASVWNLSRDSAGMMVRFKTNSPSIHVHYKLNKSNLAMPHMPATGVSGIDLYARDQNGKWKWVQVTRPATQELKVEMVKDLAPGTREYAAYLPLYNGVEFLHIGVQKGSEFERLVPREKPIVFYGTSITHGACASRPGMVHTAILGRKLDRPVVNLGFSGNGKMDEAVGKYLIQVDAAAFVIDCLPNMGPADVTAKCMPLVRQLRSAKPDTPIILVEDRRFTNDWITPAKFKFHTDNHAALRAAYDSLIKSGVTRLYYIPGDKLYGDDTEGATDASHANDLGFMRQAEAFEPILREALAAAETAHASDAKPKRPNILFAFADDWGRFASAYAKLDGAGTINDCIRTPNFDRVAREGVLFRRAFVSAPSCTPCRSAILSGQHFWRTGRASILRGAVWDGSQPAFPLLLRDSGYKIGKSYKVWSPGTPADAPYGARQYAFESAGGRFNQFSENVTKMVAAGSTIEAAKDVLYGEIRKNFDTFLQSRQPDQPFCYWFGPTNVHRKWIKGSGRALWGIEPDEFQGKLPPFLPDVAEVRQDLADYFGEAQAFDAALGILIKKLEEIGELDNTMLVVSGDHGAPGFPHGKCNLYDFGSSVSLAVRWGQAKGGRVIDDLVSLPDLAPTYLEAAGLDIPKQMTARSLIPLLQSEKTGQIDPLRQAVFIGRERHVDRARADFMPYPMRAIRTHDSLYIINFKPERWPLGDPYRLDDGNPPSIEEVTEQTYTTLPDEDAGPTKAWLVQVRKDPMWKEHFDWVYGKRPREELYDLKLDPHQTKNVARDPQYALVRAKLEKQLLDELKRTADPRLVNDGQFYETPPMSGPAGP